MDKIVPGLFDGVGWRWRGWCLAPTTAHARTYSSLRVSEWPDSTPYSILTRNNGRACDRHFRPLDHGHLDNA